MTTRLIRAAALAAGLALLAGCASTVTGAAGAADLPGAPPATEEATPPTESLSQTPDPVAPEDPADGDGETYAADIAWISAFCYDFDDINQHFGVQATGADSADEAVQQVTDGYDALIDSIYTADYELEGLVTPSFPGADDFVALVHDWNTNAVNVYQLGINQLRAGTYSSGAELKAAITDIESQMNEPLDRLNEAISDLDPVAKAIMGELPECAYLVQSPSSDVIGAGTTDTSPPAGDGPLDAGSQQWMGTFCTGVSDVINASQFDVTGMSNDEVLSTLFHAYAQMSTTADSTSFQLSKLTLPAFAGADTIAPALLDWLAAVKSTYGDGANIFSQYEYSTADDLKATINGIESAMDGPNADLDAALASIDPSVKAAIQAMPECAFLGSL